MKTLLLKLGKKALLPLLLITTITASAQNYYDSIGTVIWDATVNSGYNNHITLIGRDDTLIINQKQITNGSNPLLSVGLGNIFATNAANTNTFSNDRNYLVWGDNNGNMNDSGTDLSITFGGATGVTTTTDLPNKKWKIVESGGDVGLTKIAIPTSDLTGLPALSGNDAYVMIVASDASFTTNVETVFLTANGTKQEGNFDFDGTQYFTFGVAHETVLSRSLAFDGATNCMKVGNVNNLSATFSMMFWVKPNGQNAAANDRTILSKYDGSTGFRVYLSTDNKLNISWSGGTQLTSSTVLPNSEWHNIGVIYNSNIIKLYIDGVLDRSVASAIPATNSNIFSMGAEYRNKSDIRNYFNGEIDEVKLWNKTISGTHIRFMMNQEILQNGNKTKGTILPGTVTKNDLTSLSWASLVAYYSMNSFIGTHINDDSAYNYRGNIYTISKITVGNQTAPMPYETAANGPWTTPGSWTNGASQSLPYAKSIINNSTVISWNIVRTNHNITSSANKTLLGLIVNSNTLIANNDTKLQITHYLKLDGKIDLVGRSQLIQELNSDFDPISSGSLERDQQGQSNIYNFNYWSSPVSTINNTSINNGYTVAGVMKDGTDPNNIQDILWSSGVDGAPTSPITLSNYWIFKFQNNGISSNWSSVGETGLLLPGQGFTLKGSGALSAQQNYTFIGKPNNGTITSPILANDLNLCGNPYPSAIDANKFIRDNATSITGTLYFWEHYSTNTSHITQSYQGGYATRTLVGGTPPVAPSGVSGLGSSSKIPGKYIPVGQGFFVIGSATGGNITFGNNQRIFIKENSASSNTLFKTNSYAVSSVPDSQYDNSEDDITDDTFMKLRLGFNSTNNQHKQILIGFMNEFATSGYDNGYDAESLDNQPIDMYFLNNYKKLNIQGEGYFNQNSIYPLGVKTATSGMVSFVVDATEYFAEDQDIFIYDNVTGIYNSIKNQPYQVSLPSGTIENRFSLCFKNSNALGVVEIEIENGFTVSHSQADNMINIHSTIADVSIKSIALFNMVGQNVASLLTENLTQNEIHMPLTNISSGAYVVKVTTDKGDVTKKILVK